MVFQQLVIFFTTFVHEFGHGLNNYTALPSIARAGFNSPPINKELLKNMLCKKYLNTLEEFAQPLLYNIHMKTWYNTRLTVLKKFYDFIYKKPNSWFKNIFNCSNCNYNYNYNYFTWWITIPGHYGWSSEAEGFAEAFAYYILTPRELRNVPWGWLHQYFTKIFSKLYFN